MLNSRITEVIGDFISLFYPHCCDACGGDLVKGEEILCSGCILDMPRSNYHLDQFNQLFKRLNGRLAIEYATAFLIFRKSGKVQALLHALKYKNRPDIGRKLGFVYGEELRLANYYKNYDAIVPIPLHKSRRSERGYNQSEEFAIGLSASLGIPVNIDMVERVIKTQTQTKRTRLNRWENVQEVFRANGVNKKRILLVDDIVTTGATLEACGRELLDAGCSALSIACIAVTQ